MSIQTRTSRRFFAAGLVVVGVGTMGFMHFAPGEAGGSAHRGKAELGYSASAADSPAQEAARVNTPQSVTTAPVQVEEQPRLLRITGTLVADEESDIASNASGIAMEIRVDRGSVVRQGDVLVQLDPTDAQNMLAEGQAVSEELRVRLALDGHASTFDAESLPEVKMARAAMNLAETNFKRNAELYNRKVVSTEVYDQVRTEAESARYRYEQAVHQARQLYQSYQTALTRLALLRKMVADTTIKAPFNGVVAEKQVAVGEHVSNGPQGGKILRLIRTDPLRLALTVPQQHVGHIREGQTVRFQVDAFPGQAFTGTVRYITPGLADAGRNLVVEAEVENAAGVLRPGLFATAQLELEEHERELLVPLAAVRQEGEVGKVMVVREGVARTQVVGLGRRDGERVQVLTGLSPKDQVVLQPRDLADGALVR